MIDVDIVFLTESGEGWPAFGDGDDLVPKFKCFWKEIIPGSRDMVEFRREIDLGELKIFIPPTRPMSGALFRHFYGVVFDHDNFENRVDYLIQEYGYIPDDVLVCFISRHDKIIDRPGLCIGQTINPGNLDEMIIEYLGGIALKFFSEIDPKFKSAAQGKLNRIIRRYDKKSSRENIT